MPEFKVTVWYTQSRTVTVESRGPQSAATKAIKAAKGVEPHHPPEVNGAEVYAAGEEDGWYYDRIAGRWMKDDGGGDW